MRPPARSGRTLTLLLAAVVVLPLVITGTAAWLSWRQAWREATSEMMRAADASAEYAHRLLDGLLLRVERANDVLAGIPDREILEREAEFQQRLLQATTAGTGREPPPEVVVVDRDGWPLVASFAYPAPRQRSFATQEPNTALRGADAPPLHVTALSVADLTGRAHFAVAIRRARTGNGLPRGAYDGVVAARVYAEDISTALRRLTASDARDVLSLVRTDGMVIARSVGAVGPATRVGPGSTMLGIMQRGEERAFTIGRSTLDGEARIAAYRRIEGYPIYASVARPRASIVERWRRELAGQLAVGIPASLALLLLAVMVRRRTRALAEANRTLEQRVEERTASLRRSEDRLHLALDAAAFGSWELDLRTGRGVRTGRVVPEREGIPLTGFALDAYFRDLIHPEDAGLVRAALDRVVARQAAGYRIEYRIRTNTGDGWRWMESFGGITERDPDTGAPLRLAGVSRDVSDRKQAEDALRASEAEFRATFEDSPVAKVQADATTGRLLRVNEAFSRLTGYPAAELIAGMTYLDLTHPEDRQANQVGFRAAMRDGGRYRAEKRYLRKDGAEVWVEVSVGLIRDPQGGPAGRAIATVIDLTQRKCAEARLALLAREVDHRAKNSLAVVQAAVRLTPKGDVEAYAAAVDGRISALARVQTLLAEDRWAGASLRVLLEGELAPFVVGQRLILDGPDIVLPASTAQAMAMVVHELATNAVKHGALSCPDGRVSVTWRIETDAGRRVCIEWAESGGPPVPGPPARRGFGSRVLDATVRQQLGGSVVAGWNPGGIEYRIELPLRDPAPMR